MARSTGDGYPGHTAIRLVLVVLSVGCSSARRDTGAGGGGAATGGSPGGDGGAGGAAHDGIGGTSTGGAAGSSVAGTGGGGGSFGGSGGNAGSGAAGGSGTGGGPGTGGRSGSGGRTATGGAAGGGAGAAGSAGTAGAGGGAGAGGAGLTGWTFDDRGGPFDTFAVVPPTLGGTIGYTAVNGNPPGCLDAILGFNGSGQEIRVATRFAAPVDLRGKVLSAEVDMAAGWNDPSYPGRLKLYVLTGANGDVYAEGPRVDLLFRDIIWNVVRFDLAVPSMTTIGAYDPSRVRELGIAILSPDASPFGTLHVRIDNILIRNADAAAAR